ncbi:MAG: cell division protein FtsL [Candidatus Acidiferrum sp.]
MATAYQWRGPANDDFLPAEEFRKPEPLRPRLISRLADQPVVLSNRRRKSPLVEFCTVKRIDNSRLVRQIEPVKMRNLYKTVALGLMISAFCMCYVYQHFRCIDLGFQLEDLKSKTQQAQTLNSELKLEIAFLRDPHRIDLIARRQLGLTQPAANQVREFASQDSAEVAAMQYVRPNHAP